MAIHPYEAWTFEEALRFVRKLEPTVAVAGFHVAMAGSVLHEGHSFNDLDLVLFPHSTGRVEMYDVRAALDLAGLSPVSSRATVAAAWERRKSFDTKHVEVWTYEDKRVDLFFLR